MKKAVIATGGKQYLVAEGQTLDVDLLNTDKKTAKFEPLMVIDGNNITIGAPIVKGASVSVSIQEAEVRAEKVTAIRYKPKKRVRKVRGHRQKHTTIKVDKIS